MDKRIVLLIITLFLSNGLAGEAETGHGRFGLTASLTNAHLDIVVPIFVTETISIAPALSLASVEEVRSDYSLGALFRYHFSRDIYAPFVGLGLAAFTYSPDEDTIYPGNTEKQTDLLISPHLGIERYFDQRFCIGISAQLNVIQADEYSYRLGYADKQVINTATSIYATLFFW